MNQVPQPMFGGRSPNEVEQPYEYQEWPAYRVNPDTGQRVSYRSAEEVPEGWVTPDEYAVVKEELAALAALDPEDDDSDQSEKQSGGPSGVEQPRQLTADQRKDLIDKLVDGHTQKELVEILEAMQALDDKIEFLPAWPKPKLAEAIVDNGGPLEEEG